MGRRHFDDYDPNDWQENEKKAKKEKQKRDAKRQKHADGDEKREPERR